MENTTNKDGFITVKVEIPEKGWMVKTAVQKIFGKDWEYFYRYNNPKNDRF